MALMVAMSKIVVSDNIRTISGADKIEDLAKASLSEFPLDFQAEVKNLAESIRQNGLINPITVKDMGRGERFRLIAGFRRLKAVQLLGRTRIDVKSVKGPTEDEVVLQLVENVHRENLNPMDVARTLQRIMRVKGYSKQASLIGVVNKSAPWISQHLALLKADKSVQAAIVSGEIGVGGARQLSSLSREEQKGAVDAAKREAADAGKKGISTKGVRRQACKIKASKRKKQASIRPVVEREVEQRTQLVKDFVDDYFGDTPVPDGAERLLVAFWGFLFSKNRLVIER